MPISRKQHNNYQQTIFDKDADTYKQAIPEDVQQRTQQIVAAARLTADDRVLDIGTGQGVLIPYFKSYNVREIVGCDLTQAMLDGAKTSHPDVSFWCGDFIDFPDDQEHFTAIFFNAMFGNVWDQHLVLKKALSLLEPRGRIVLSHPMGSEYVRELHRKDPKLVPGSYPDKQQIEALITEHPLRVQEFRDAHLLYICVLEKYQK